MLLGKTEKLMGRRRVVADGNKYKKGLEGRGGVYCRELGELSTERLACTRNMWRDHGASDREDVAESRAALVTAPGYRRIFSASGKKIYGVHPFSGADGTEYLAIHAGDDLYRIPPELAEGLGSDISAYLVGSGMAERRSQAFEFGGELYILDGERYYVLGAVGRLRAVEDEAYVPITYLDNSVLEARNMLSRDFINRYTGKNVNAPGYGWKYAKRHSSDGSCYASIIGLECTPADMRYAYIPQIVYIDGESEPLRVLSYENSAFEALSETVQLVCDAPLDFAEYSLGRMSSLERVVLRSPDASFAFNACDFNNGGKGVAGSAPLKELWTNATLYYDGAEHAYSHSEYGICSSSESVTVYASQGTDMWYGSSGAWCPTRTRTVYGVRFYEGVTSGCIELMGASDVSAVNSGGEGIVGIDEISGGYRVRFSDDRAYTHCTLAFKGAKGENAMYCILLRDVKNGMTNDERQEKSSYFLREYTSEIVGVEIDGRAREYARDGERGHVLVTLFPSDKGKTLDIRGRGDIRLSAESTYFPDIPDIYDKGAPAELATSAMIDRCTVCCRFDGKVFFTGAPELPNTVFYTSTDMNGVERAAYIGVYNFFNVGGGTERNNAMLAISERLAVFKDGSSDADVYYYRGKDTNVADIYSLRPRYYIAVGSVHTSPCVGEVGMLEGVPIYLSEDGVKCITGSLGYIESRVQSRSRQITGGLRGLGRDAVIREWDGYLCVLGRNGEMYLADGTSVFKDGGTGERQYEWFSWDGIGTWIGDRAKPVYSESLYISAVNTESGEEEQIELFSGTSAEVSAGMFPSLPELSYSRLPIRRGRGEVCADGEIYGYSVLYSSGVRYELADGASLECVLVRGDGGAYFLCPVRQSDERIGGEFSPACALAQRGGKLYFGTECGDVCVFNTDRRGYGINGETVGSAELLSCWYDRCGHRYTSGFSTLADDCGYPTLKKSTVPKTLVIKAKALSGGEFSLKAVSEREDVEFSQRFTASNGSFDELDMSNFSFGGGGVRILVASEKLKGWCEKQLHLYSDGFRHPFGIYGISYLYTLSGKVR